MAEWEIGLSSTNLCKLACRKLDARERYRCSGRRRLRWERARDTLREAFLLDATTHFPPLPTPAKTLFFPLHKGQTFSGCPARQSAVSPSDIVPRPRPKRRRSQNPNSCLFQVPLGCQSFCLFATTCPSASSPIVSVFQERFLLSAIMQNEEGENVDLYIPRKW